MVTNNMIEIEQGIWYDRETGLPWTSKRSNGSIKGPTYDNPLRLLTGKNTSGYVQVWIDGKKLYWHRLVWRFFKGLIPADKQVDHINNNRVDNRIENLQLLSSKDNSRCQKIHLKNTSGFPGVFWHKREKKWYANICINYKCHHLGSYDDINDAYAVYYEAKIKFHGPESVRCIPVPINNCSADSVLV